MTDFSQTLRTWRKTRRFSQLDLALEADVSSRHISFLETGRAQPSTQMIERLSEAMQLPLTARNQLLTGAGFVPRYQTRDWDSSEMEPIRTAIKHMLDSHAPYPAIALDQLWSLTQMNQPAEKLFGLFQISTTDSLLELLQSPLLPQVIENWAEVAHHTAQRLRTESMAQGGIKALDDTAQHLSQMQPAQQLQPAPMIPTIYRMGDLRLSLFSTIAQFGTPEDLSISDLKIELFFPADDDTKAILQNMS